MKFPLLMAVAALASLNAQNLRIYAIDVEGGKATLYVSPAGESMLVDTGYPGNDNRDADRIVAAANAAGVKHIDHLVITHYHGDHVGGVPQLLAKIPVGHFYDHGANSESTSPTTLQVFQPYVEARSKHPYTLLHPGDRIPVKGLQIDVVAANGDVIDNALPGAGQPNPFCQNAKTLSPDPGENGRSVALLITFGNLRIADFGDLYWNQEHALACPANRIGVVDLYMTTHHGTNVSGSPQIVHAIHPRVAIMNNGADKGGSVEALTTLHGSPGLLDLWQLHYSNAAGPENNTAADFIANRAGQPDGRWIEVSAQKNGSFTVRNTANKFEKTYRK